jgi:hypothetical protein
MIPVIGLLRRDDFSSFVSGMMVGIFDRLATEAMPVNL